MRRLQDAMPTARSSASSRARISGSACIGRAGGITTVSAMPILACGKAPSAIRSMRGRSIGKRGGAVDDHLVLQRVIACQHIDQHLAIRRVGGEAGHRLIPDHAHLPQDQIGGGIDTALVEQQLAGLVVLAAISARIDAEIGVQAILGGNARLHVRAGSPRHGRARSLCAAPRQTRRGDRRTRRTPACPRAPRRASPRPSASRCPCASCLRGNTAAGCARPHASASTTAPPRRRKARRTPRPPARYGCAPAGRGGRPGSCLGRRKPGFRVNALHPWCLLAAGINQSVVPESRFDGNASISGRIRSSGSGNTMVEDLPLLDMSASVCR